jgi:predicted nucleic acid-binding protein
MIERYFVDTNVLVYARDAGEPGKQPVAVEWLGYLWRSGAGRLSIQVLQEYYNVVTRKLDPGLPPDQARADVRDLMAWTPIGIDLDMLQSAWRVEDRFGFSWWDSLIIASAQHLNCRYLLSEDFQHGQQIGELTIADPFRTELPASPAETS